MSSGILDNLVASLPAPASGNHPPSTPEPRPVLAVEQANLGYGRRVVLRDVTVRIRQGEFWCLLGPNGEGKTTFIKALLGALRPLRGKIFLRQDFANRTRLGFVPQESDLNPAVPTTVSEFISCGFVGLQLDGPTRDSRMRRVLDLMGLVRLRERSFWTLSSGQRQRALVARALVRDPVLLIVDEPTAGLDLAAASGLLEVITDLSRNKGITVLFVTHDLQIAGQRASHIALFRNGAVIAGAIDDIFTEEHLSRTFGVPIEIHHGVHGGRNVVAHPPSIHA